MASLFYYKSTQYFHVYEVSIIGKFNNFDPKATPLIKERDGWYTNIDLPKGEHAYKFLLNRVLKLNDPTAGNYLPDEAGEIWSIAVIGKKRERIKEEKNAHIELIRHVISNQKSRDLDKIRYKNSFNLNMDLSVVGGFEFGNILGVHSITAVWMTPLFNIHHIDEHSLEVKEGDLNNGAEVWFWIPIQEKQREYPKGIWTIKLFVDGLFAMEARFNIGTGGTYCVNYKGVKINHHFEESN